MEVLIGTVVTLQKFCGTNIMPELISHHNTIYVISLYNISIKTHLKQITRVELKLANLYNTLRETTFWAWRHFICFRSFTNNMLHRVLNNHPTTLLLEHCGPYSCRKYWKYGYDNMTMNSWYIIWVNEYKQSLCLCFLHWYIFPAF